MNEINPQDEITDETKRSDLINYLIKLHTTGYQLSETVTKGAKYREYISNKGDGTTIIFKEIKNGGFDVLKSCPGITLQEIENFLK